MLALTQKSLLRLGFEAGYAPEVLKQKVNFSWAFVLITSFVSSKTLEKVLLRNWHA
jgi:hypothetical protein